MMPVSWMVQIERCVLFLFRLSWLSVGEFDEISRFGCGEKVSFCPCMCVTTLRHVLYLRTWQPRWHCHVVYCRCSVIVFSSHSYVSLPNVSCFFSRTCSTSPSRAPPANRWQHCPSQHPWRWCPCTVTISCWRWQRSDTLHWLTETGLPNSHWDYIRFSQRLLWIKRRKFVISWSIFFTTIMYLYWCNYIA